MKTDMGLRNARLKFRQVGLRDSHHGETPSGGASAGECG